MFLQEGKASDLVKACVSIYREAIKSEVEKVNNISIQVKFRILWSL